MKDKMENEYNRTKVQDRRNILENALTKDKFNLNQTKAPRIIENLSNRANINRDSYLNKKIRANLMRASKLNPVLSKLGAGGVVSLQVRGKSQLIKELNECTGLTGASDLQNAKKIIHDVDALHRNELTKEVEPEGNVDEFMD